MPLYTVARDWDWSRDDCVDYLLMELGVVWPKSTCDVFPYINKAGWPEQLRRFVDRPAEAVAHIIDEYTWR